MKNYFKVIVAFFILLFLILNFFNYKTPFFSDNSIIEPQEPSFQYGILVDSFNVKKEIVAVFFKKLLRCILFPYFFYD